MQARGAVRSTSVLPHPYATGPGIGEHVGTIAGDPPVDASPEKLVGKQDLLDAQLLCRYKHKKLWALRALTGSIRALVSSSTWAAACGGRLANTKKTQNHAHPENIRRDLIGSPSGGCTHVDTHRPFFAGRQAHARLQGNQDSSSRER